MSLITECCNVPIDDDWRFCPKCGHEARALPVLEEPPVSADPQQLLKRVIVAWDSDESLEFMAAVIAARKHLGLKLADEDEDQADIDVITANGYASDGEPLSRPAPRAPELWGFDGLIARIEQHLEDVMSPSATHRLLGEASTALQQARPAPRAGKEQYLDKLRTTSEQLAERTLQTEHFAPRAGAAEEPT